MIQKIYQKIKKKKTNILKKRLQNIKLIFIHTHIYEDEIRNAVSSLQHVESNSIGFFIYWIGNSKIPSSETTREKRKRKRKREREREDRKFEILINRFITTHIYKNAAQHENETSKTASFLQEAKTVRASLASTTKRTVLQSAIRNAESEAEVKAGSEGEETRAH